MAETQTYRIMGIDPGTNYMGYGIIEVEGREVRSVVMGDIDLHTMSDPYRKLRYIFDRVGKLIDDYQPREVALESPFFGANVQSMLKLGRAQGVAMAAALSHDKEVFEYAPTRIKQAITSGKARTDRHIVENRHIVKQSDVLICSGNSQIGQLARGHTCNIFALINDRAGCRLLNSRRIIDASGFSRTIGTNQCQNFTLFQG